MTWSTMTHKLVIVEESVIFILSVVCLSFYPTRNQLSITSPPSQSMTSFITCWSQRHIEVIPTLTDRTPQPLTVLPGALRRRSWGMSFFGMALNKEVYVCSHLQGLISEAISVYFHTANGIRSCAQAGSRAHMHACMHKRMWPDCRTPAWWPVSGSRRAT